MQTTATHPATPAPPRFTKPWFRAAKGRVPDYRPGPVLLAAFWAWSAIAAGQVTNQITAVSPSSAAQGATGVTVSFTLDSDTPPPPPAGVMPNSVTLGGVSGTSITHSTRTVVTARFDIPQSAAVGNAAASIVFTTPHGTLTFSSAAGFSITASDDSGSGTGGGAPYEGYNLFGSLGDTDTHVMDNSGNVVHTWSSAYRPGNAAYLLENGTLLRTANDMSTHFSVGGAGGRLEQYDWDGNLVWEFDYSSATFRSHHDVEVLPNGNILLIAWELKTEAECLAAGRNPGLLTSGELWPDTVIEVQPSGSSGGTIVWEWHAWDHLVQDYDAGKPNYGVVSDHSGKIDLNYASNGSADWHHVNSIDYNAELDQILLSVRNFSEIWVIDHSTTTAEAAGPAGDLLYRWGNPQAYDAGTAADQQLFVQHDAKWLDSGNILVFNNGGGRSGGNYSSVDEIVPPVNADGSYNLTAGSAFGPTAPAWTYVADTPADFYATNISGAQRLPNGNTLICDGPSARFFEVTAAGQTVWEHTASGNVFRCERYGVDYAGFDGTDLDDADTDDGSADGGAGSGSAGSYAIVDTSQNTFYSDSSVISAPAVGAAFYGQDASYSGNQASYTLSADGLTVKDNVTGLTWQQTADTDGDGDIDASDKLYWSQLDTHVATLNAANYGGHSDWRVPSIKELYSLMDFRGTDPSGYNGTDPSGLTPYIDPDTFAFGWGDTSAGERIIDAQYASSTLYVSTTMGGNQTMFGLNLADGRIKGYPTNYKNYYVICCRGNTDYGVNDFADNGDGTVTDNATGLMWTQADSGSGMNWQDALAYAESLTTGGHTDWRLPNAKELQSIIDYTRSPDTTGSAAIDPALSCTRITNEGGVADYPFYWTGTTHGNTRGTGDWGAYVCFGRGLGYWNYAWTDVHGAGCQRSDPKRDNGTNYSYGHGPQGDAVRILNYVRAVRDTDVSVVDNTAPEIEVSVDAVDVQEGTGSVDFGSTPEAVPVDIVFTIRNAGDGELTLTPPISAPAGFEVTSGFGTNNVAAGASTTFTVQLEAAEAGTYGGALSIVSNDSDENPFDFTISGTVTGGDGGGGGAGPNGGMTIEQTLSDEAQRNTIAFDALAFLTGSLGADSFFPPGKVADFWGFQYLRDNDPSGMGHNTDFLTRAANNVLSVLSDSQTAELVALAENQVDSINQYAYDRFVLMDAFRRLLENDLPVGATGLDLDAVLAYSAQLYQLDGAISYERAQVMGGIISSLTASQREYLDAMVGQGMTSWPDVADQLDPRDYTHDVHVAVMTYAGDIFSWYAGSVDADVYFCPERQGTYFGSFYLKDAPAMGNPDYTIDSNLTAENGAAFLAALDADQAQLVTDLVDIQRTDLQAIVDRRTEVAAELRRFMAGGAADEAAVLDLMMQYGEFDGAIVYSYASVFAAVGQSLSGSQQAALAQLRAALGVSVPDGAYLYSEPIDMPVIPNSDFLFDGVAQGETLELVLEPGWNFLSVPENADGVDGLSNHAPLWVWDPARRAYSDTPPADLIGRAFWVHNATGEQTTVSVRLPSGTSEQGTIVLARGWNQIAPPADIPLSTLSNTDQIRAPIWYWDATAQRYRSLRRDGTLERGRGYWIRTASREGLTLSYGR